MKAKYLSVDDELVQEFRQKVDEVGGVSRITNGEGGDDDVMDISVYLPGHVDDEHCLAAIDWMPDSRYQGAQTFNVDVYNENTKPSETVARLQALTVEYAAKFLAKSRENKKQSLPHVGSNHDHRLLRGVGIGLILGGFLAKLARDWF